jgi:hypothetical protein
MCGATLLVEGARSAVERKANTAAQRDNGHVGREIVIIEQAGRKGAGNGELLMARLSERLTARLGRGPKYRHAAPNASALPNRSAGLSAPGQICSPALASGAPHPAM